MTFTRASLLLALCLGPLACGGGSTVGSGGPSGLLPDLPGPAATVGGGAAEGASGNGTDSGA